MTRSRLFPVALGILLFLSPLVVPAQVPTAASVPSPDDGSSSEDGGSSADPKPSKESSKGPQAGEYHEAYRVVEKLNAGLTADPLIHERQTPQATLELLVAAVENKDLLRAAQALNLNNLPVEHQGIRGPHLANQLYHLLDRQVGIDWEGLPDRPDGHNDFYSVGPNSQPQSPRRSLPIGTLTLDGRDVVLRLQRIKPRDSAPVWVFSTRTVDRLPELYERYGPTWIDRVMPPWAKWQFLGTTPLWAWIGFLTFLGLGIALALFLRRWLKHRLKSSDEEWVVGLGKKIASPAAALAGGTVVYILCVTLLEMPGLVNHLILVALVLAVTWLAMRAIAYLTEHILSDRVDNISDLAGDDHNQYQQWLTYLSVGRRLFIFLIFLVAGGVIIGQFRSLQALGVSLVASAGVASIILGIAAQPLLANIVAGAQIAIARPVRIGDSVLYEGSWGYVEDVTYTYLTIQTWDQRRLIVPLRYFISKPFENWTIKSAHLTKPIYFHAHYTIDVSAVREKFEELLRSSDDWDEENEPEVIVTKAGDETVELRAVCSAKDASTAWNLHCWLREEMLTFLQELDGGIHLPKRRIEILEGSSSRAESEKRSGDDRDRDRNDGDRNDGDRDAKRDRKSQAVTDDHPGGNTQRSDGDDGDGE